MAVRHLYFVSVALFYERCMTPRDIMGVGFILVKWEHTGPQLSEWNTVKQCRGLEQARATELDRYVGLLTFYHTARRYPAGVLILFSSWSTLRCYQLRFPEKDLTCFTRDIKN